METTKRVRSANFNKAETHSLLDLVGRYKYIIDSKRTDMATNKAKDAAWRQIQRCFNSSGISENFRSCKTLKAKYDVIKRNKYPQLLEDQNRRPSLGDSEDIDPEKKCCKTEDQIVRQDNNSFVSSSWNESLISDSSRIDTECGKEFMRQKCPESKASKVLEKGGIKEGILTKLQDLSTVRLELVHLEIEMAKREKLFLKEEHKLKMLHLANSERRKQEIHRLIIQKINSMNSISDIMGFKEDT